MERILWDKFTVDIPFGQVVEKLHLEEADDIDLMRGKWQQACRIARPKALYRVCDCKVQSPDEVLVEDTLFKSRILASKLEGIHRVFAYVATCGTEVDEWSHREEDPIVGLWLDMLKEMILVQARARFVEKMQERYGVDTFAGMAPGSGNLDTWPIAQQRPLFDLIGGVKEDIGVTLTDSFLMLPTKSVSGILFPSAVDFVTCSLCKRENCVGRKAPYTGE